MSIQVRIQNVFGNEVIYPVCEKAKVFARMKGQSSLTRSDISCIKELGYSIELVAKKVSL